MVGVSGELDYVWHDPAGAANTRSSLFNIKLALGALKQEVELGEGGAREIITRKTQQLKLDAKNYRTDFIPEHDPGRTNCSPLSAD